MSIAYTINREQRIVTLTARDTLNRTMLEGVFKSIVNDAAHDPTFDMMADFSDVVYLDLDMIDIQSLAAKMLNGKTIKGRFAIITGEDQGRYSLGVYFKALADGMSDTGQRIFRTASEAQVWLDQDLRSTA